MKTKAELIQAPEYWMEIIQNELYRCVKEYMEEEGLNQTELADKLQVSKGYVSQVLNGNFNYTLKKLIELSLAVGVVPDLKLRRADRYLVMDRLKRQFEIMLSHKETISYKNEDITSISSSSSFAYSVSSSEQGYSSIRLCQEEETIDAA